MKYAHKQFKKAGFYITVYQWLGLKYIQEFPQINQQELSRRVFKEQASITRIIDLLVKRGMVTRKMRENELRRNFLTVTLGNADTKGNMAGDHQEQGYRAKWHRATRTGSR